MGSGASLAKRAPAPAGALLEQEPSASAPPGPEVALGPDENVPAAVRAAAKGQVIRLRRGRYICEEGVVLDKEVHIVGPRDAFLECRTGPVLLCKEGAVPSVRGISIRGLHTGSPAVLISGGSRAVIEGCDIWAEWLSGVVVSQRGTWPFLRRNVVHGCGESGLFFNTSARGIVEGNEVFGCSLPGLVIDSGASPFVLRNAIHDNREAGVVVYEGGDGTFEGNDVYSNDAAGVPLKLRPRLVVRENRPDGTMRVRPGVRVGDVLRWAADGQTLRLAPGRYKEQLVLDKSVAVAGPREAVLESDAGVAVLCTGDAAPRLSGLTVRCTAEGCPAVRIVEGSRAVLDGCDISTAAAAGCGVEAAGEGTAPLLRGNEVHDCVQAGLFFHSGAAGAVEGNTVVRNRRAGLWIDSGARPAVRGNAIHGNREAGVVVFAAGGGTLEDNSVAGNEPLGIDVQEGAAAVVRINQADEELLVGSGATLGEAIRRAHSGQTIRVAPGRYVEQVVLEGKDVHVVGPRGVVLEWGADATVHCSGPVAPVFDGISIRCTVPLRPAVRITGGSRAVLEDCEVVSAGAGVEVSGPGTAPKLVRSRVRACGQDGVFFFDRAAGLVQACTVEGCAGAAVSIGSGADPAVLNNSLRGNGAGGVLVADGGAGTIQGNDDGDGGGAGAVASHESASEEPAAAELVQL